MGRVNVKLVNRIKVLDMVPRIYLILFINREEIRFPVPACEGGIYCMYHMSGMYSS
jgi:hypothetical protein